MNYNRKKYEKIVEKENKEKSIFKESLRDILFINIIYIPTSQISITLASHPMFSRYFNKSDVLMNIVFSFVFG